MSEQLVVQLIRALSSTQVGKRGGGTYPGAELVYSFDGKNYTKGIHEKVLANNQELFSKIKSLESKTNVPIVLVREKVGEFINIIDVREAVPGEQSSPRPQNSGASGQSDTSAFTARFNDLEARVTALETQSQSDEVPY